MQKTKQKNTPVMLIVGIVLLFFVLVFAVPFIIIFGHVMPALTANTNKLSCAAEGHDAKVAYTDEGVVGLTLVNTRYNLKKLQKSAEQDGIEAFLSNFEEDFTSRYGGSCHIEFAEQEQ